MLYEINHVHLKAPDPLKTAQWYVRAFNFTIASDTVRTGGDRFIKCEAPGGMVVNISGARTGEKLNPGDANAHWGLEHFGLTVVDLKAEIARLQSLGAKLLEVPAPQPGGRPIAFLKGPDDTRIELIQG